MTQTPAAPGDAILHIAPTPIAEAKSRDGLMGSSPIQITAKETRYVMHVNGVSLTINHTLPDVGSGNSPAPTTSEGTRGTKRELVQPRPPLKGPGGPCTGMASRGLPLVKPVW